MSVKITRGDVLPFNFGTKTKPKEVFGLVVSDDIFNTLNADTLVIVPACVMGGLPSRVELDGVDMGLTKPAYAACEQLRSVKRDRITGPSAGMVSHDTMVDVERAMMRMLGIKPTTRAKGWGK